MMFPKSRYSVITVETVEELVRKLTEMTWYRCNGFRFGGMLFLNDATGPDGAQEYAVLREDTMEQIESLTVSWMEPTELTAWIEETLEHGLNTGVGPWQVRITHEAIQTPEEHGTCMYCR